MILKSSPIIPCMFIFEDIAFKSLFIVPSMFDSAVNKNKSPFIVVSMFCCGANTYVFSFWYSFIVGVSATVMLASKIISIDIIISWSLFFLFI